MTSFGDRVRDWFRRLGPGKETGAGGPDAPPHDSVVDLIARELGVVEPAAELPVPVSAGRIAAWMTENSFSYFVDSDGDLGGMWRGRLFYFFLFGEHQEILQVRGQWQREVSIERMGEILDICNEWNADRIWPKAYVRVRDNGRVHVVTEVAIDLEHGATDAQLHQALFCGLSTGSMFFDALEEQYPDPVGAAP